MQHAVCAHVLWGLDACALCQVPESDRVFSRLPSAPYVYPNSNSIPIPIPVHAYTIERYTTWHVGVFASFPSQCFRAGEARSMAMGHMDYGLWAWRKGRSEGGTRKDTCSRVSALAVGKPKLEPKLERNNT